MLKKTLIAAAALAAVSAGLASTAQAKVNFDIHVNAPGLYIDPGYYPVDYDDDCFYKKVKVVKWHNHGGWLHKHIKWKNKLVCY